MPLIQKSTIRVLANQGVSEKHLSSLNSSSASLRASSLRKLFSFTKIPQAKRAIPIYAKIMLKDPNPLVQRAALEVLLKLGRSEGFSRLEEDISRTKKIGPILNFMDKTMDGMNIEGRNKMRDIIQNNIVPRMTSREIKITQKQFNQLVLMTL